MSRSIRHARLTAALATTALAAAGLAAAAPAQAVPTSSTTLVVNANQTLRSVTHVATGSLYGLANDSTPTDSLTNALKPNTFVQMAPGGSQLPNGEPSPAGDALVVAPKAARAGAKVVVRMPDWYPNFPYKWVSWTDWLSAVDKQIASVKSSGATNIAAYELWNEPDWTWDTTNAGAFDAGWARTYKEVRAKDATTPIQGPSYSAWNQSWMTTFLTDAKASGTVPDVIAWHELQGSKDIAAHVSAYRALESSLGISPRPISIEEYAEPSEMGIPGSLIGYVAKFERAGVHDAELAFWNHYGTLGDTLTDTGGSPNGSYWMYKWYGDMSGNMVVTTPPAQTGIDGIASLNGSGNQLSVIAGGCAGSCAVTVNGLSSLSAFGGTVHVKLEYTPNTGRTTASPGPITISDADYTVSGGSITVPVTMNASDGYHLVITPSGTSTSLAGRYQITNKNSGLALDTLNAGTAQGTSVVQATSTTGTDQNWTLVAAGSGLYKIVNQKSGLLLGITNASTASGGTALIWGDNGTADHLWQLLPARDGYYKIANYNSGRLLGVDQMSTASGAQVLQWDDNGTADHLWRLTAR
ncbi:RICIN domain-containing protein [Streptomyces griseorubiginosus]|uniref:RICIN domain-containing protein n=1 Tax=Streptomyces griseorubiginosus TaxID=67304 RepID=UPI002E800B81|nr:RICIN domain-containing protein [Streptomyces griseorubiginosus]WUB42083.1 RICIN domain-containing protein [Streptomyces griseorubiginosus]WUB50602.1 RICIN domain-containing protein [Streptomyces griseorubiginosus]